MINIEKNITNSMKKHYRHPFHLVRPSAWPFLVSVNVFYTVIIIVTFVFKHGELELPSDYFASSSLSLAQIITLSYILPSFNWIHKLAAIFFIVIICAWFWDIIVEGTYEGHHTKAVQQGLRYGMLLFIASEVMFFFGFFWAFFHSSLSPNIEIGAIWPPKGIVPFDPWKIPLLNTMILLTSGATVTWAHHALMAGNRKEVLDSLFLTVVLGIIFTCFQAYEYSTALFTISDTVYGSIFYLATGFHGFHVIIGTIFLFICFIRHVFYHFTRTHHFGFEAAAWYWHFVDVVWLFLFISIYWWGS